MEGPISEDQDEPDIYMVPCRTHLESHASIAVCERERERERQRERERERERVSPPLGFQNEPTGTSEQARRGRTTAPGPIFTRTKRWHIAVNH